MAKHESIPTANYLTQMMEHKKAHPDQKTDDMLDEAMQRRQDMGMQQTSLKKTRALDKAHPSTKYTNGRTHTTCLSPKRTQTTN